MTYKDGSTEVFDTIELASEKTGLSINSIKCRANKPGSGSKSKDGLTFQWADESVRRSKKAKQNKKKGNGLELEIVHRLREIGYTGCTSSRSVNKLADNNKIDIIDVNDELPINLQAKYTQNMPNYFDIKDSCTDKSKPFGIIWKKSGKNGEHSRGTVAVIDVEFFYKLLSKQ